MFKIGLGVRDYECDMQGIVNNAVYQNYFEHARHEFLLAQGTSFSELLSQGIHAVLVKIEIQFKHSLKSGDLFEVSVELKRASRLKFMFEQTIIRTSDQTLMTTAKATAVLIGPDGQVQSPDALLTSISNIPA